MKPLKIKSIEITDEYIPMFDVCNMKNERFVANGIVTHNSAADMTKIAAIKTNNDEILRNLDGRVIIPVHDELILQSPLRNARVVKDRFAHIMETAVDDKLKVDIKCDVTVSTNWYGEELDLDKELEGLSDD